MQYVYFRFPIQKLLSKDLKGYLLFEAALIWK